MKKVLLLLCTCVCLSTLLAQNDDGKVFVGFVTAGLNPTQIAGDGMAGYRKIGGYLGVGSHIMFTENWSTSLEISYSMKGSQSAFTNNNPTAFRKFVLDYAEIPVMFHYHDKRVAIFGAGFSFGRLVRARVTEGGIEQLTNFKDWEFGFTTGATFLLKERYGLNVKGTFSLNSIIKGIDPASNARKNGLYHNALSARFIYYFIPKE